MSRFNAGQRLRDRVPLAELTAWLREFERLLDLAEEQATKQWDMDFVADLQDRYKQWGAAMFYSDGQHAQLKRIAGENNG